MMDERIEGGLRRGVGRVQDAIGALSGDAGAQVRGKLNQAAGSAQSAVGQARDLTRSVVDEVDAYARQKPLQALGIALALGVGLGLMLLGGRERSTR